MRPGKLQAWTRLLDDPASARRLAWTIFLTGLFLRVATILAVHDWTRPRTWEFGEIVNNLLAGKGYSYEGWYLPLRETACYAPLYVFLSYFVRLACGAAGFAVIQCIQAAAGALGALLLFFLGRRVFDQRTGLWAGLVLAANPIHAYMVTQMLPIILIETGLIAAVLACQILTETRAVRWAVILGAILGLALLTEPAILCFVPVAIAWPLLTRLRDWKRGLVLAATVAAATTVVISPWTIRNYMLFQRIIPIRDASGCILWLGNHPGATGTLTCLNAQGELVAPGEPLPPDVAQKLHTMREPEAYEELGRIAWEYIRAHPGETLLLDLKKAFYFWWFPFWINCPTCAKGNFFTTFHHLENVPWAFVLITAFVGAILARSQWRRWLLLVMPMLLYTMTYAALQIGNNCRYRLSIECLVMVFSGVTLAWLTQLWEARQPARP